MIKEHLGPASVRLPSFEVREYQNSGRGQMDALVVQTTILERFTKIIMVHANLR